MSEIAIGAEAVISKTDEGLVKERIKKEYRLSQIDEKLRSRRTKLEASLLREARRIGVNVPRVFQEQKYSIEMEQICGRLVKDALDENNCEEIGKAIGRQIALLHEYNIVHGDLTTSNMIVKENSYDIYTEPNKETGHKFGSLIASNKKYYPDYFVGSLYFIDFGLGFTSQRIEDKAVDLYLFYHAIESTHWNLLENFWKIILNTYKAHFKDSDKVIKTLNQIEKRGRYKDRSLER